MRWSRAEYAKWEHKDIAEYLVGELEDWGAYIYYEATTGSVYIKFPHWALGSIRVSNHRGITRYRYRWRVRTDGKHKQVNRFDDRGVSVLEVGVAKLDLLVNEFEQAALSRGVTPGQKETWEEYCERKVEPQGQG